MIADLFIVLTSFLVVSSIYPSAVEVVIESYQSPFLIFIILFLIISFSLNKYENIRSRTFLTTLMIYAQAFMYAIGISLLAMYLFKQTYYSPLNILRTMLGIAILEFVWIVLFSCHPASVFQAQQ